MEDSHEKDVNYERSLSTIDPATLLEPVHSEPTPTTEPNSTKLNIMFDIILN